MPQARFTAVSDHAVLVQLGDEISDQINLEIQSLDRAISAAGINGFLESIPAFVNILVVFDPLVTDHGSIEAAIKPLLADVSAVQGQGTERLIRLCYDPDLAPDLPAVAAQAGLSEDAVIKLHLSRSYRVGMYGFAPGYAYLSGVNEAIQVPRKPAAVRDVPAGSVIIAGPQCLVTTLTMPTGWSIIGRSPTEILTDDPRHPFLFDVGDSVRFERIDRATFEAEKGARHG